MLGFKNQWWTLMKKMLAFCKPQTSQYSRGTHFMRFEKRNVADNRINGRSSLITGLSAAFEMCIKKTQFVRKRHSPAVRRSAPRCCQRHNSIWKESHIYKICLIFMTLCQLYLLSGQQTFSRKQYMKAERAPSLSLVQHVSAVE